jgi:hypothetical protein
MVLSRVKERNFPPLILYWVCSRTPLFPRKRSSHHGNTLLLLDRDDRSITVVIEPSVDLGHVVSLGGIIKGKGEEFSTPDIVLGMLKDPVVPKEEVEPYSYAPGEFRT